MRLLLLLSLTLLAACAGTVRPGGTSPGTASLAGAIAYPSEFSPAMRICAFRADDATPTCIDSAAGQTRYRIDHLAAGEYRVVASLSEGDMRLGGHMHQVQCIRAPCPDLLQSVTVPAGAAVTGIDLNEFYAARTDFPRVP